MTQDAAPPPVQIDIISDVMCPWCLVGFRQLEMALGQAGRGARVRWHPFELNPDMPEGGEPLDAHLQRKYGADAERIARSRREMQEIGAALGIRFALGPESRIVNSFKAHVLLDHAATQGRQHPLTLALFAAHFDAGRDLSDPDTLLDIAGTVGLDREGCRAALASPAHANAVRAQERVWQDTGITGVPTMIFAEKYLVTGAQGPKGYARILDRVQADAA